MGSGRGKMRRVRSAVAASSVGVVYNMEKWRKFVESVSSNDEMSTLRLDEYYLGKKVRMVGSEDFERLYSEIFSDAISVGAIVLPEDYRADDFEFMVSPAACKVYVPEVRICLKSNPLMEVDLNHSAHNIMGYDPLSHMNTARQLNIIAQEIQTLLESV